MYGTNGGRVGVGRGNTCAGNDAAYGIIACTTGRFNFKLIVVDFFFLLLFFLDANFKQTFCMGELLVYLFLLLLLSSLQHATVANV